MERRRISDSLEDKLDKLMDLLGEHIDDEEVQIADIQKSIEKYFGEIDAHLHKYHHEELDKDLKQREEQHQWLNKLKQGIAEKILLVIIGAIFMYLSHVIWEDVKSEVKAPTPAVHTHQQ